METTTTTKPTQQAPLTSNTHRSQQEQEHHPSAPKKTRLQTLKSQIAAIRERANIEQNQPPKQQQQSSQHTFIATHKSSVAKKKTSIHKLLIANKTKCKSILYASSENLETYYNYFRSTGIPTTTSIAEIPKNGDFCFVADVNAKPKINENIGATDFIIFIDLPQSLNEFSELIKRHTTSTTDYTILMLFKFDGQNQFEKRLIKRGDFKRHMYPENFRFGSEPNVRQLQQLQKSIQSHADVSRTGSRSRCHFPQQIYE